MIPEQIIKKTTKNTKAIILTHIYGYPVDMQRILIFAKKKKIFIIEDAAEMIGQKYKKKICGSFGDISTFSFYANKHITTGEGGMIVTNNKKIYSKSKSLRNLCFNSGDNRFNHDDIGWNYRFTNMQADLGLSQLKRIKNIVKTKKKIGNYYYKHLKDNKKILVQPPTQNKQKNIYWVFGVLIKDNNFKKKAVIKKLLKKGIQCRDFFWPMHKQKVFIKNKIFKKNKFPTADLLSKNGFYIPSGINITKKQMKYVADSINGVFK